MEKNTSWTSATTDLSVALMGLHSCLKSGRNAWLEIQVNGEQDHPILMRNPDLQNPFNWKSSHGSIRPPFDDLSYDDPMQFFLANEWVELFGDDEAIEAYQKEGRITENLGMGMGTRHLVTIKDANKWREEFRNDCYEYGHWMINPTPKDGIPYKVPADIREVFVVCNNNEPVDYEVSIRKAGKFLIDYSDTFLPF